MTAEIDDESRKRSYGSHETADPSRLTTAQILREVGALKELVFIELGGIKDAIKIAHDDQERFPTAIQQAVSNIEEIRTAKIEVINEKFKIVDKTFEVVLEKIAGINSRFDQLDRRLDKSAADATVALANALQAAKELVTLQNENNAASILKSDTTTDKKLEGQGVSIATMRDGFTAALNEIKGRFDRWESAALGRAEQQTTARETTKEGRDNTHLWIAGVGVIFGLLSTIGMVLSFVLRR